MGESSYLHIINVLGAVFLKHWQYVSHHPLLSHHLGQLVQTEGQHSTDAPLEGREGQVVINFR